MILWVKFLHVVSVISWMAALLYLPRLMVYHTQAEAGSQQSETFKVMERRLLRAIANPAMVATWIFGLLALWLTEAWRDGWMWAKFGCVLLLSGFHGAAVRWVREFAADSNTRSTRFFRLANEVPTVLMILIVLLVIVKPF